jgi:coatomer subunit beta
MKTALAMLSASGGSVNAPPSSITSSLLMTIIRFVMPNQRNKLVKKLVLLFFELVPKTDSQGKLLSEIILLCNALRSDLHHANEYVRGSTLRFLTRCCRQSEIIEPLVPSIRQCLEHRHAYVRRQAVLAISAIHFQGNEALIPDAAQTIETFLTVETDPATRRAAFEMLTRADVEAASRFLDRSRKFYLILMTLSTETCDPIQKF